MSVAALVMHPGHGITIFPALHSVGAAGSLKIPGTHPKLCGGIFGQVMGQALPIKAYLKAA